MLDREGLLQQVSDYAVMRLLADLQARLAHVESALAAVVASAAPVVAAGAAAPVTTADCAAAVSMETEGAAGASGRVSMETPLAPLLGNARLAAVLARAGFGTVSEVAAAGDEQLLKIDGVSEKALRLIREKTACS
jgi:predicted flap endonuclease-1-like 5' DNA nuclease